MKTIFTLALVSALKRKQIKEVLAELLIIDGKEDESAMVTSAGRFTSALIDRAVASSIAETETEIATEEEAAEHLEEQISEHEAKEKDTPITVADIKALVKDGSKRSLKAAKKALKEQFSKEHPNYKELKQLIKKAGK